ncbi:MarR family transcriptional regulator [Paenibacillus sp. HN-1]|uniref:MarR family winged helix-turn-helix transcriptional regulator n=1 Tax=Paenibacillus TaxID=44249 RepID=UPI001CA8B63A|nr:MULTISPECIES: MarR family transcriptional regulator [Paenibacillus]MBY9081752.1 MarR family transcriptional regulator [Paenibacillus sp. CGMCC 1.18879]MBY9083621.1 MarR family transcriptional regulator [Paenibacillus sinensis]
MNPNDTSRKEPIGRLISNIHRSQQKYLSRSLGEYDIGGGGQHSFLKAILHSPGTTQEQLTCDLKFDKATTARSVKQLEDAGYIERRTDPGDRRSYLLFPTNKALEFLPVLQRVLDESNAKMTRDLTDEEKQQLTLLLQKIRLDL